MFLSGHFKFGYSLFNSGRVIPKRNLRKKERKKERKKRKEGRKEGKKEGRDRERSETPCKTKHIPLLWGYVTIAKSVKVIRS